MNHRPFGSKITIRPGLVTAFLGPNGAGKTTPNTILGLALLGQLVIVVLGALMIDPYAWMVLAKVRAIVVLLYTPAAYIFDQLGLGPDDNRRVIAALRYLEQ